MTAILFAATILGAPVTKKNSPRVGYVGKRCPLCRRGRPVVLPSAQYERWAASAVAQLATMQPPHLNQAVNLAAIYYRAKRIGDKVNYEEALCDVLEDAGVVTNDRWITQADGSRLAHDKANPRIELVLTAV